MKKHSRLYEEVILKSWWMILIFLFGFFAFDQGMKTKALEEEQLRKKLAALSEEMTVVSEKNAKLKLERASLDDPEWIELTLMRCLGLVPEDATKIHFQKRNVQEAPCK